MEPSTPIRDSSSMIKQLFPASNPAGPHFPVTPQLSTATAFRSPWWKELSPFKDHHHAPSSPPFTPHLSQLSDGSASISSSSSCLRQTHTPDTPSSDTMHSSSSSSSSLSFGQLHLLKMLHEADASCVAHLQAQFSSPSHLLSSPTRLPHVTPEMHSQPSSTIMNISMGMPMADAGAGLGLGLFSSPAVGSERPINFATPPSSQQTQQHSQQPQRTSRLLDYTRGIELDDDDSAQFSSPTSNASVVSMLSPPPRTIEEKAAASMSADSRADNQSDLVSTPAPIKQSSESSFDVCAPLSATSSPITESATSTASASAATTSRSGRRIRPAARFEPGDGTLAGLGVPTSSSTLSSSSSSSASFVLFSPSAPSSIFPISASLSSSSSESSRQQLSSAATTAAVSSAPIISAVSATPPILDAVPARSSFRLQGHRSARKAAGGDATLAAKTQGPSPTRSPTPPSSSPPVSSKLVASAATAALSPPEASATVVASASAAPTPSAVAVATRSRALRSSAKSTAPESAYDATPIDVEKGSTDCSVSDTSALHASTSTPVPDSGSAASGSGKKEERKSCNCKKSRCLKLYCECFARGDFCRDCGCVGCHNTPDFSELRQEAIQQTLARDALAFQPKVRLRALQPDAAPGSEAAQSALPLPLHTVAHKLVHAHAHAHTQGLHALLANAAAGAEGAGTGAVELATVHHKGCHCKKSNCQKKYCECFQAGVPCSSQCKCVDCKNCDDSHGSGGSQSQASAPGVGSQHKNGAKSNKRSAVGSSAPSVPQTESTGTAAAAVVANPAASAALSAANNTSARTSASILALALLLSSNRAAANAVSAANAVNAASGLSVSSSSSSQRIGPTAAAEHNADSHNVNVNNSTAPASQQMVNLDSVSSPPPESTQLQIETSQSSSTPARGGSTAAGSRISTRSSARQASAIFNSPAPVRSGRPMETPPPARPARGHNNASSSLDNSPAPLGSAALDSLMIMSPPAHSPFSHCHYRSHAHEQHEQREHTHTHSHSHSSLLSPVPMAHLWGTPSRPVGMGLAASPPSSASGLSAPVLLDQSSASAVSLSAASPLYPASSPSLLSASLPHSSSSLFSSARFTGPSPSLSMFVSSGHHRSSLAPIAKLLPPSSSPVFCASAPSPLSLKSMPACDPNPALLDTPVILMTAASSPLDALAAPGSSSPTSSILMMPSSFSCLPSPSPTFDILGKRAAPECGSAESASLSAAAGSAIETRKLRTPTKRAKLAA